MSDEKWTVTFTVYRKKDEQPARYDTFTLEVSPDEYVLDAVERIWAFHDRSLVFAHACHHSTCGACGMRVNGVERLTCITPIREVTRNGGTVRVEPLRNFPVVSDLAVDMSRLYRAMDAVQAPAVHPLDAAPLEGGGIRPPREVPQPEDEGEFYRLADCIECGLCVSACPVAGTDPTYLGPAALAGAQLQGVAQNPDLLGVVDCAEGVWRCHSAYECTAVCPSNVQPGWRIMDLRRQVVAQRIKALFGKG
ncbi:succinate dehydrogenase/fumarate reductase iron-sulfur subunit [Anaerolinea thermophila]|uniref:Fumarate reductase iron-sulfur subunit n=2 Tax=Anaerolinea TaxID=233189 RepID=E8N142_ANATU|nr:2Fe-2S iron-sulfur cluster-binding protein [Anaerolinea thermophila]BAJ64785.1 succinate dehydrogenase iron-sulfur subunit [Anaerolinea thermophila UNI-1]